MLAATFGFGAALCWGLGDFLGGIRARRLTLVFVLLVSQLTGLVAVAILLAAAQLEAPTVPEVLPAVGAGICELVGIAALYRALAAGTMSVISPVSASGAAVLPVVVGIADGERPAALQFAGMAAALVGVILATRAPVAPGAAIVSRQALGFAAIAALGFGGFYVGIDPAVEAAGPFWALFVARCGGCAALSLTMIFLRPRLGANRADLPALALIGLLDIAANACFALGTDTGLLSVVAVLASLYPAATVVLARAVLKERLVAIQAAGIAIALAGVALIAAG